MPDLLPLQTLRPDAVPLSKVSKAEEDIAKTPKKDVAINPKNHSLGRWQSRGRYYQEKDPAYFMRHSMLFFCIPYGCFCVCTLLISTRCRSLIFAVYQSIFHSPTPTLCMARQHPPHYAQHFNSIPPPKLTLRLGLDLLARWACC